MLELIPFDILKHEVIWHLRLDIETLKNLQKVSKSCQLGSRMYLKFYQLIVLKTISKLRRKIRKKKSQKEFIMKTPFNHFYRTHDHFLRTMVKEGVPKFLRKTLLDEFIILRKIWKHQYNKETNNHGQYPDTAPIKCHLEVKQIDP